MITNLKNKNAISGFTLIEMTVAITVGLMLAVMSLTLFNSQLKSFEILKTQNFLVSEAPQINNTLNRIVSRANFFRMYTKLPDAVNGQNSVITGGKVLVLKFEDPSSPAQSSFGVIAFDNPKNTLNYYRLKNMAQLGGAQPDWSISTQVSAAVFYIQNGVLLIKLTGPNSEEIIFSTTTQR